MKIFQNISDFFEKFRKRSYDNYLGSRRWEELRRVALERSNYKCDFCSEPYKAVHHIAYPKRYKDDHVDNLLVVCGKCHGKLHGIRNGHSLKNEERLYSEELPAGGRTYLFDIRYDARTGKRCLSVSESWKRGTRQIRIFEHWFQVFSNGFGRAINFMNIRKDMNELFSEKVFAGKSTYFFDIQYTVDEYLYLTITESKKMADNSFRRNKIMVFEEDFQPFSHCLNKTRDYLK
ncbi:DUF3276 family protein [Candidatus Electrothrix sp.]|uniref:DUF3276 family protein n=2 Tax=Candidatus Electrothrix sp. TaxID=2170559 RepID=UPI0040575445